MTTWEQLAHNASVEKLRHYVAGSGYAPAMREAAAAELERREGRCPDVTPDADLAARWRPSDAQVAEAVAQLREVYHRDDEERRWLAAVPLVMPGKVHGFWEVGQVVEHPAGVWLGLNRAEVMPTEESYSVARDKASDAAREALGDRPGTVGWAVVRPDGTFAVFEDF